MGDIRNKIAKIERARAEKAAFAAFMRVTESRCLVPVTSFSEYDHRTTPPTCTWFAQDETRLLMFFAGIWQPWKGMRGTKAVPDEGDHLLYAFLTAEPNAVGPTASGTGFCRPDRRQGPETGCATMIEVNIWMAATLFIQQHGDRAELEAALWGDEMRAQGSTSGTAAWDRIIAAIMVLRKQTPSQQSVN